MPEYSLTEMSITGNMPASEMNSRRINWLTNSTRKATVTPDADEKINIAPQQIRVFLLEFKPESQEVEMVQMWYQI